MHLFQVRTKDGALLFYKADYAKEAQAEAEKAGHVVSMVVKYRGPKDE